MARSESPADIEREYFLPEYGMVVIATSPEAAAALAKGGEQPASPIIEETPHA